MANIRQIEAPSGIGLNPSETGIEAFAAVGRRVGAFGNQIADTFNQEGSQLKSTIGDVGSVADNYLTHRDISAGAANGTAIVANANTQWNEIAKKADPNDPSTAQKFLTETLEPALDKFKEGFTTERSQQWAEQFTDQYRKHMFEKTAADMSSLAGIAIQQNVHSTVNQLSSAAASDPSSLDFALKTIDHAIGGMTSTNQNLDAETSAKVNSQLTQQAKESVVKAAVSGMITKNPNIDLDAIQQKYGEYIKGDEMKMFQKAAQAQAKSDFLTQKSIESYQIKEKERAVAADLSKTFSDKVSYDNNGKATIKPGYFDEIMQSVRNHGAGEETARALIGFGQRQLQEKREIINTNREKQSDLLSRMNDPNNPTTETQILEAANRDELDDRARNNLLALRKATDEAPNHDPVYTATLDAAKNIIMQSFEGNENYANFMYSFMPEYKRQKQAGTLKPNALDMSDPTSLISQQMKQFKPSEDQKMRYHIMKNIGTDPSNIQNFNGKNETTPAASPTVTTKEQFEKLPSGKTYVGTDGRKYRKP